MVSIKLQKLKEPLELMMQLVATELDTSAKMLYAIAEDELSDAIEIQRFKSMVEDITRNSAHIVGFDDSTDLYEYREMPIVVFANIHRRAIIFDKDYKREIESLFSQL